MAEKQNLVEEALIQMKSLENVVAENAKGILASTMKEEISELVKESLNETEGDSDLTLDTSYNQDLEEAEGDEEDMDMDFDVEDDMEDDNEMDDEDEDEDFGFDVPSMDSDEDEPIDLRKFSDDEILKVFKEMGEEDGIIVTKDGDTVDLEDTDADVHYKISMGESAIPNPEDVMDEELEEGMFEINFDDEDDDSDFDWTELSNDDADESDNLSMMGDNDDDEDFQASFNDFEEEGDGEEEELMFEIIMDEDDSSDFEAPSMDEEWNEDADIEKMETKEGFKPKGVGMGKAKFDYKKTQGGFKEDMKHGNPTKGTGKPKFEFKEGDDMEQPKMKRPMNVKGGETTEAARTLGNGKSWGRNGLPKTKAAPRHLKVESVEKEVSLLRERNEEYRKALNVFRTKLNEVAVFNSNLAYATRLFTEHSTTKQEKINILRRFDSVESLKESKSLYKTIKDELTSQSTSKVVKESLQEKMEKNPSSGSAVNLIESKTYENPQFMRMKDLMTKMNVIK